MKKYGLALIVSYLCCLASSEGSIISIDNFAFTPNSYSYNADMPEIIKTTLGENYRLADWSDIVGYHNEGNDMNLFTDLIGSTRMWVSRYGNEFASTSRHYFINISNHSTPSGFLVHDHIDNHLIDLGSWWNSRPILAYTDTPIPEPTTLCMLGLGSLMLAGKKRLNKRFKKQMTDNTI